MESHSCRDDASRLTLSVRINGPFWLAPGSIRQLYFRREVIKWIIAVLANGVVTRSKSRRADAPAQLPHSRSSFDDSCETTPGGLDAPWSKPAGFLMRLY